MWQSWTLNRKMQGPDRYPKRSPRPHVVQAPCEKLSAGPSQLHRETHKHKETTQPVLQSLRGLPLTLTEKYKGDQAGSCCLIPAVDSSTAYSLQVLPGSALLSLPLTPCCQTPILFLHNPFCIKTLEVPSCHLHLFLPHNSAPRQTPLYL